MILYLTYEICGDVMNDNILDNCFFTEDSLTDYLNMIGRIPLLTVDEEKELGYKILEGDTEAVNEMIIHNLRYVVSIAKWYKNFGLPLADLIQDGNIGLIEAANTFDVTKGFKFSTYARDRIIQKIEIGIANTSRNIRLPYHKFNKLIKYLKAKKRLTISLGRVPSRDEIATALNMDIDMIKQYEELENDTLSLNYLLDGDDKYEFGNVLSSNRDVEDEVLRNDLPNEIEELFEAANLDDIDIEILKKRFGFDNFEMHKFNEIGIEHDRTTTWANQKTIKALRKIKNTKYFKDTFN